MRQSWTISLYVSSALVAAFLVPANAAEPTKLWDLSGFEAPESTLPDPAAGILYVSNVNGKPTDKDGNGYISKVSLDGKVIAQKWVTGLNAPKGMIKSGGTLFVTDIDQLVEIDIASGGIKAKYDASGAQFLNDPAIDGAGHVYVSDLVTNVIWRLANSKFESWLASPELINPNGMLVQGDTLVVASWGAMTPDWATKVPGRLLEVSLSDKSIKNIGNGSPVGNLDGLEAVDADSFIVSDWVSGKISRVTRAGEATVLLSLTQGTADIGYIGASKTLFIPRMKDGLVAAYKLAD